MLTPLVALFGILGNALNLVVLTRRSLRYTMDHLEKSAPPVTQRRPAPAQWRIPLGKVRSFLSAFLQEKWTHSG